MTELLARYRLSITWVLCVAYGIYVWRIYELVTR